MLRALRESTMAANTNTGNASPADAAPAIATLPRDAALDDLLAHIERDGAVIVEDMIEAPLLARLNAELDDAIRATPPGARTVDPVIRKFWGANTIRFSRLAARSPSFVELLIHPLLLAWADRALLPNCGSYWLNTGQVMVVGPGEPAQFLHRDMGNWLFFYKLGPASPEVTVSCMFALSDFSDEAGATRIIPGSHHWPDYFNHGTHDQTVAAAMRAGSGLLYSGKVVHGAGANRTRDQWRRGLHVSYVLGWLTPEEASPLAVPWETARTLPERARQLLGYASGKAYGGRVWLIDFEDAALMYRKDD
jgi:ectoine hydroxylase-related dioxygenase (phytanoyl-CoA dioxygenase family)